MPFETLTVEDFLRTSDYHDSNSVSTTLEFMNDSDNLKEGLNGVLNFINPANGQLLFRKSNKVVLRGRTFAIENVFKKMVNPQVATNYLANLNRKVNFFKVGKGGTPINDLFAPLTISPISEMLNSEIPFQSIPSNAQLLATDPTTYILPVVEGAKTSYYGKQFDNRDPEFIFSKEDNRVAIRMELSISEYDLRDRYINELGLYFSTTSFAQPELYSKVHFPSESFTGTKGLLVEYWAFA
jgi:hypothetical protein